MLLPDGTFADVVALSLDGNTITATITVAWPKGPKAQGVVTFAPTMLVQASTLVAPGDPNNKL